MVPPRASCAWAKPSSRRTSRLLLHARRVSDGRKRTNPFRLSCLNGKSGAQSAGTHRMTVDPQDQARILIEALPHMQRYDEEIVVVKYGGHAMGDEAAA